MRYFLCFVAPPLAVLSCGRPIGSLLNLLLTLMCWAPGVYHALLTVKERQEQRRSYEQMLHQTRLAQWQRDSTRGPSSGRTSTR